MNLLEVIQIGTFIVVGYQAYSNNNHKKIDRQVSAKVENQREKQRKLLDHIAEILHIERKFVFHNTEDDKLSPYQLESIEHHIGVIANINSKNKYGNDLRNECLELTFWFSGLRNKEKESDYIEVRDRTVANIWTIIEDYIKEEEKLIEEMIK